MLKNAGYSVQSVSDGQQALAALREGRFDLVLMDVQMPRLDGVAATRQLRRGGAGETARNIAVVALTAYTSSTDRENFLEAGMDDAVSKPAEEKALFAAMERALAAARSRAAARTTGAESAAKEAEAPLGRAGSGAQGGQQPDRLDGEYLSRSFGDNLPLLALLLRQFLDKSLPEIERGLAQSLAASDLRQGRGAAHRARGTLASIGAARGANLAAGAEAAAVSGSMTKRLETEQQLIQASKMATLGEMATGMAHELNQPLSVIKTAASFIRRKVDRDEEIARDILATLTAEIDAHVDRASRIINHLREFGRKPEMQFGPVDAGAVLGRALDIFSQQLKLREIEVVLDIAPELPPVTADAGRLEQVFINMLINARDAIEDKWSAARARGETPAGGKRITLAARREAQTVRVEIADTGAGIPESVREKIFEPFFTTKPVGKGTGLGLSISYGIVKDCGGTIRAESIPGEGARFIITLPLAGGEEAA